MQPVEEVEGERRLGEGERLERWVCRAARRQVVISFERLLPNNGAKNAHGFLDGLSRSP